MRKRKLWILLTFVLGYLLNACQLPSPQFGREIAADGGSYKVVSVQELQKMLENQDFTLINVHIPWQGNIPETDIHLPYDQINEHMDELPPDKDTKILVYCLTSGMAKIAVQSFLELGYTNLWILEGGTTAWEEAGLTLNKE